MNTPIALSVFFFIYIYFIIWAFWGLRKLVKNPPANNKTLRSYSVIIAAHNEEKNLPGCLQALAGQQYPRGRYQIIVVADRCDDNTAIVAKTYQTQLPDLRIIIINETPKGVSPKKHAIAQAIKKARFEHLLFLDADVNPTPNHINAMNRFFNDQTAAVVSLMKFTQPKSFWQRFLAFEKLISWCVAGAGIGFCKPVISYGGNWGYTKSAFQKVKGFESIKNSLSGDDDLLLQKMGESGLPSAFCLDPQGWIKTDPPKTMGAFFRQRRRHFSAGKRYRFRIKAGYFLYHTSNLVIWFSGIFYEPAFLFLLVKLVGDYLVIKYGSKIFREKISFLTAIVFDFIYMVYNTMIGPVGHIGKIKW